LPAAAFSTPDLDAQTATRAEIGWLAGHGALSWDATTYYSWIENELLSLRDATGASLGATNADETIHLGVELGLTAEMQLLPVAGLAWVVAFLSFAGIYGQILLLTRTQ